MPMTILPGPLPATRLTAVMTDIYEEVCQLVDDTPAGELEYTLSVYYENGTTAEFYTVESMMLYDHQPVKKIRLVAERLRHCPSCYCHLEWKEETNRVVAERIGGGLVYVPRSNTAVKCKHGSPTPS